MAFNIKLFPIEFSPGFIIHKLDTQLAAGLHRAFRAAGYELRAEQWGVLNKLWEEEGLHQSELAVRLSKDRHNMTRILTVLEKNGFVIRKADAGDRRRQMIFLTEMGRGSQERLTAVVRDFLETCLLGLSREEVEEMTRLHLHILRNVENLEK